MMKRVIFLLIGIFFIAFGCNDDALYTDSELEQVNASYAKNGMVPTKGEVFITVDEYDAQNLGHKGKMSGFFSHMGKINESKSTWENMSHDFSQFPPLITFIQHVQFCAANGDLLFGTYTGTLDFTTSEVNGSMAVEGGTGRFENATGYTHDKGYAWYDEYGRVEGIYLAGKGEISNVGSSK